MVNNKPLWLLFTKKKKKKEVKGLFGKNWGLGADGELKK